MRKLFVIALAMASLVLTGAGGGCQPETGSQPTKVGEQNDAVRAGWRVGQERDLLPDNVIERRTDADTAQGNMPDGIVDPRPASARVVDPQRLRTAHLKVHMDGSPYVVHVRVRHDDVSVFGNWTVAAGDFETTVSYTSGVKLLIKLEMTGVPRQLVGKATSGAYCQIQDPNTSHQRRQSVDSPGNPWRKIGGCYADLETVQ